ncbi:MAG: hypothetical protein WAM39_33035 [Bryobacteraceae bacterium]
MKRNSVRISVFAAQDRFTLKSPNGIAFSEFRAYETWESVAPSQTNDDQGHSGESRDDQRRIASTR